MWALASLKDSWEGQNWPSGGVLRRQRVAVSRVLFFVRSQRFQATTSGRDL